MIELRLPPPHGYIGHLVRVHELDLEIETAETPGVMFDPAESAFGNFRNAVLAQRGEFTSADFSAYATTRRAASYLDRMRKKNLIVRTGRKQSIPIGKPLWIYRLP